MQSQLGFNLYDICAFKKFICNGVIVHGLIFIYSFSHIFIYILIHTYIYVCVFIYMHENEDNEYKVHSVMPNTCNCAVSSSY